MEKKNLIKLYTEKLEGFRKIRNNAATSFREEQHLAAICSEISGFINQLESLDKEPKFVRLWNNDKYYLEVGVLYLTYLKNETIIYQYWEKEGWEKDDDVLYFKELEIKKKKKSIFNIFN